MSVFLLVGKLLDVELRSREVLVFFVRSLQQPRNRLDSLFEVHRQVVLHKDTESKVTKKIFVFCRPHKNSEETYLVYTRADDSFCQLGRHVWCLPAQAIKLVSFLFQTIFSYFLSKGFKHQSSIVEFIFSVDRL